MDARTLPVRQRSAPSPSPTGLSRMFTRLFVVPMASPAPITATSSTKAVSQFELECNGAGGGPMIGGQTS